VESVPSGGYRHLMGEIKGFSPTTKISGPARRDPLDCVFSLVLKKGGGLKVWRVQSHVSLPSHGLTPQAKEEKVM